MMNETKDGACKCGNRTFAGVPGFIGAPHGPACKAVCEACGEAYEIGKAELRGCTITFDDSGHTDPLLPKDDDG